MSTKNEYLNLKNLELITIYENAKQEFLNSLNKVENISVSLFNKRINILNKFLKVIF